jgi:Asp-tRNA(Asn)/Glu-tRNA(Gln) amidotransferase A subunit family amidase
MVIGLIIDDGVVKIHTPIERALRQLVAKLQKAGHEIVPLGYL